jgi:hypothetical protein
MGSRTRHGRTTDQTDLDSKMVAALPDKLAAITLDLRHLCYSDASHIGPQAIVTIGNCCARLHSAMTDVLQIVRYLDAQSPSVDGAVSAARRARNRAGKLLGD